uniref:Copper transport protein n=1 Tax=Ascaris lumbricoides TaxID=6252 RepID=A0A0M3ITP5_ASCLU
MASLYEGIKWFRVYLQMSVGAPTPQCSQSKRYDVQKGLLEDAPSNGGDIYAPTTTPPPKVNCDSSGVTFLDGASPLAPMRIVQALLYLIQLVLAYWLMLVVMTYNSWLTAAVVVGAAFGHWLFAVLKCLNPQADHLDTYGYREISVRYFYPSSTPSVESFSHMLCGPQVKDGVHIFQETDDSLVRRAGMVLYAKGLKRLIVRYGYREISVRYFYPSSTPSVESFPHMLCGPQVKDGVHISEKQTIHLYDELVWSCMLKD